MFYGQSTIKAENIFDAGDRKFSWPNPVQFSAEGLRREHKCASEITGGGFYVDF